MSVAKGMENNGEQKSATRVHSSLSHNSQEVEAAQVPINGRMDKQNLSKYTSDFIKPPEGGHSHMIPALRRLEAGGLRI